jgi:hypothetical protein
VSSPAARSRAATGANQGSRSSRRSRSIRSSRGESASRAPEGSPSASSTARSPASRTSSALGPDFCDVDGDEQDRRLDAAPAFKALLYEHACEGTYGAPEYGGNRDALAWAAIKFPGDIQPRGYTDAEVSGRE